MILVFGISVSSRSTWEEVLSVKTKIDLLMECYYKVLSTYDRRDRPHSLSLLGEERRDSFAMLGHEVTEGTEFGYSSVRDWDTLVDTELQRSFKQWEEKYLTEIHQTLMPALSQYASRGSSEANSVDVHTITSMLRVACSASDIPTKPIYLDTGSLNNCQPD